MTEAEKLLIEKVLAAEPGKDLYDLGIDELVMAVRQERLPAELFAAVLEQETKYQQFMEEYRSRANDFALNYPRETVDAAYSKARKQLRGSR